MLELKGMGSKQQWFVSKRAENLAIVLFTRFRSVHVDRAYPDAGFDLRVVVDFDKPQAGQFGVRVEGHIGPIVDHNHVRPQFSRAPRKTLKDCDFPVALLVFDVKNDNGLFGWLLAPKITGDGPTLEGSDTVSLESATNRRIESALSEFRRWHKALTARTDHKPTIEVHERVRRKLSYD
jgi:hypothetical protein